MGFIFRTVFWLGLAIVILPPKARLGGDQTADFERVNLSQALENAGTAAWSVGTNALRTCETNPGLCKASLELWDTTVETATSLAGEVQNRLQNVPEPALKTAEARIHAPKKIQARVE